MNDKARQFFLPRWWELLAEEFSKDYMNNLRAFLQEEYRAQRIIYPPKEKIFRAFSFTDYDDVKVCLLGQDPYHGPGQANGLAFAVNAGVPLPPSLRNIFQEVHNDIGKLYPNSTLENWAKSGVLLLNTALTVRQGEANSHQGKGWEVFTDRVIELLNAREKPVVFFLWGRNAWQKRSLITGKQHLVLEAAHPSPLSAHRGFLGCRHFSKANNFLSRFSEPIAWEYP